MGWIMGGMGGMGRRRHRGETTPTEDNVEGNGDREGEMTTTMTNDTPPPSSLTSNCLWGGLWVEWVEWVGDDMEGR